MSEPTSFLDDEIQKATTIAKELNFLKPNGEPDFEACLNFLIEIDRLQTLQSSEQMSSNISPHLVPEKKTPVTNHKGVN